MARRSVKPQIYNYRIRCPHCDADVEFPSLMEQIQRRDCPICKREMLIEDGRAVKVPGEGSKKPPKQVRSPDAKAKK